MREIESIDPEDPDVPTEEDAKRYKNFIRRAWAFMLYPESAPEDWEKRLMLSGTRAAVSPLHDQDVNKKGKIKPHYHVLLHYDGPTRFSAVSQFTKFEMGGTYPKAVNHPRGYYSYLSHKNAPEKFQYDEKEIRLFNGFDAEAFADLTTSDKRKLMRELTQFIFDTGLTEFSDFIQIILEDKENPEAFYVASSNTRYFVPLLNSMRFRNPKLSKKIVSEKNKSKKTVAMVDMETGEILGEEEESLEE